MPMDLFFHSGPRSGFPVGCTTITGASVRGFDSGLDFSVVRPRLGETITEAHSDESAWVLLRGAAELEFDGTRVTVRQANVFDEPPTALHLGPHTPVVIRSQSDDTEWAIVRTPNERAFAPRLFLPADLKPEYRGAGLVQNACLRNVRLIFDRTTRPEPNLVVGEVVNYPGRWSSYPPHHNDQSEIYHYRFTHPDGYGHAELGDDVLKVRAHAPESHPAAITRKSPCRLRQVSSLHA